MRDRRLILLRHAHRYKPYGQAYDNGISPKGMRQVEKLLGYWSQAVDECDATAFLSSPKKRCLETVGPLAELCGKDLVIDPLLDEEGRGGPVDLRGRATRFLQRARSEMRERLVVACSHGDWIPVCYREATGEDVFVKKGEWVEIAI